MNCVCLLVLSSPECTDSADSVSTVEELLLEVHNDPYVILVGEAGWVKLGKIGIVFKNARLRTAFEGRRYGSADDVDVDRFHIFRTDGCKFLASKGRNSDYVGPDKKTRENLHVVNFAFSEKLPMRPLWLIRLARLRVLMLWPLPRSW